MNILEEVLSTKSNEDILMIYQQFLELGEHESSAKLRAGFILRNYFEKNDLGDELQYFVNEENEDIKEKFFDDDMKGWKRIQYSTSEIPEYTTINALIYAKMLKDMLSDSELYSLVLDKGQYEEILFGIDVFRFRFLKVVFSYVTRGRFFASSSSQFIQLIAPMQKNNKVLAGIYDSFTKGREIDHYYERVKDQFNELVNSENPEEEKVELISKSLLLIMILYLFREQYLEANLILLQVLSILPKTNHLYWTVRFLEKEIENKVPTVN